MANNHSITTFATYFLNIHRLIAYETEVSLRLCIVCNSDDDLNQVICTYLHDSVQYQMFPWIDSMSYFYPPSFLPIYAYTGQYRASI